MKLLQKIIYKQTATKPHKLLSFACFTLFNVSPKILKWPD